MNIPAAILPRHLAIARIVAVFLVVLWVHWIDWFGPLATAAFFALLAAAGMLLALTYFPRLPQPPALRTLTSDDQLAIWIVLAVLAIIGYLHNANAWLPDGAFNRPTDMALWKTELVLCISLTVPLVRWLATALIPGWGETGGSYFAREFALYVNFSGVAIILWTGEAALSRAALAALLALIVLAELTLHADR